MSLQCCIWVAAVAVTSLPVLASDEFDEEVNAKPTVAKIPQSIVARLMRVSLQDVIELGSKYPYDMLGACAVVVFLVMYVTGRAKNRSIMAAVAEELSLPMRGQFAETGISAKDKSTGITRTSDTTCESFNSGRRYCHGCLIEVRLKPRQNLFSYLASAGIVTTALAMIGMPAAAFQSLSSVDDVDTISLEFPLEPRDAPSGVFTVMPTDARKQKDFMEARPDVAAFSPETKLKQELGAPAGVTCFAEHKDLADALLGGTAAVGKCLVGKSSAPAGSTGPRLRELHLTDLADMVGREIFRTRVLSGTILRLEYELRTAPGSSDCGVKAIVEQACALVDRLGRLELSAAARYRIDSSRLASQRKKEAAAAEERMLAVRAEKLAAEEVAEAARIRRMSPAQRDKYEKKKEEAEMEKTKKRMAKRMAVSVQG